jgi:hypothetical protein
VYNNTLFAAGDFATAGGVNVNRIAQWNGSSWSAMGSGMNAVVYALIGFDGDLIAGGTFNIAGGNVSAYWARWGQTDTDTDGALDCYDGCPNDVNKIAPGVCGCGIPDIDSDGDGTADCNDGCPNDPIKITPGICGCGTPEGTCQRTITAWRSVRSHGGTDLSIALNPTATGNGSSGPTSETRSGGIQKIEVDFSGLATLVNLAGVTVIGYTTSGGVMGPQTPYTPAPVSMVDGDTMQILFNPGDLPDESCYVINIDSSTITEGIGGDTDCKVRALMGDVNNSGVVNTTDQSLVKSKVSTTTLASAAPNCDLNVSGGDINTTDQSLLKSRVTSPAKQALCP